MLYRAQVYRLHTLRSPSQTVDVATVFFDAATDNAIAAATVIRLVSLAWGIPASQVDFHGDLLDEHQLLARANLPERWGDLRLLEQGWYQGPLFVDERSVLCYAAPAVAKRINGAQALRRMYQRYQHGAQQLMADVSAWPPQQRPPHDGLAAGAL